MSLVPLHEILHDATRRKYGVPCLLASSTEMLVAEVSTAELSDSPLILAHNSAVTPRIPDAIAFPAMVTLAEASNVPIATILDHGDSFESCAGAIEHGSSSVMFDGSSLPYEENVRMTAEVVRYAHRHGVSVEGELGAVGGSSVELGKAADVASTQTDPSLAQDFVARTGVDVLAISFGNSHGIYSGPPKLNLELVREIADLVDVPLAMHGASGLAFDEYRTIIDSGISKINYYTAMGRNVTHQIKDWLDNAPDEEIVYHHLTDRAIEGFEEQTRQLLDILGCSGKASGMS